MSMETQVDSTGKEYTEIHAGTPGAAVLGATVDTTGVQAVLGATTPKAATCTTAVGNTSVRSPLVLAGDADAAITARTGGTVRAPDVATGGAGNVAGTDLKVRGGVGTGTGTPGKVLLQAAPAASSGDNAQTAVTVATVAATSITLADAVNLVVNATTGTQIATAGSQKIAFYGAAPTIQQTGIAVSAAAIHAALVTLGLITA